MFALLNNIQSSVVRDFHNQTQFLVDFFRTVQNNHALIYIYTSIVLNIVKYKLFLSSGYSKSNHFLFLQIQCCISPRLPSCTNG